MMLNLTQQELADRLGITCQQLQKYEKGASRIAAGRLYMIAQALGSSVGCFFAGVQEPEAQAPLPVPAPDHAAGQTTPPAEEDALTALLLALGLPRAVSAPPRTPDAEADKDLPSRHRAGATKHKVAA
jgi:transcriptional regulator with XRE-family HTH domain